MTFSKTWWTTLRWKQGSLHERLDGTVRIFVSAWGLSLLRVNCTYGNGDKIANHKKPKRSISSLVHMGSSKANILTETHYWWQYWLCTRRRRQAWPCFLDLPTWRVGTNQPSRKCKIQQHHRMYGLLLMSKGMGNRTMPRWSCCTVSGTSWRKNTCPAKSWAYPGSLVCWSALIGMNR